MSSEAPSGTTWGVPIPSVDSSLGMKLLPFVLGFIAGSVDVLGFLGLDGLFTAHITGNLVVLAAHIVARGEASLALVISVPLFIIVLAATRVLAAGLERGGIPSLGVLLFVQFALLCGFLGTCIAAGPGVSASAPSMILAGMLDVSAMAVQNALVLDLARWCTVHRGADDKYNAAHDGHRRDNSWAGPEPYRQSTPTRQAHFASSRWLSFWLRARRMVRSRNRHARPRAAGELRACRSGVGYHLQASLRAYEQ
jgi:hypothetical protein